MYTQLNKTAKKETKMKTLNKYIGEFIPRSISDKFKIGNSLDASNCKKLLESHGYKVVKNKELGRHGLATTSCGLTLSTSGYLNNGLIITR